MIYNRKSQLDRRRLLRCNSTVTEQRLWMRLRLKQLQGCKFRRQFGIGFYIADFYCPSAQLVIELDGSSHDSDEAFKNDNERQKDIEALGIKVLRFTDEDVLTNIDGVLEEVLKHLNERIHLP
ncbi:endonuclease domain-containing protein [Patescibacteria group bacterium]|nr:endonuclease domain-containing protein [Patescibacteria group bacterium]